MNTRPFYWCILITVIGIVLHLFAIQRGHFYFTVDQGRDAVYAREIALGHDFPLKGPETTIRGIFIGPIWYYFTALGLLLTNWHPVGVVYLVIGFNIIFSIWLFNFLSKKIGLFWSGLLVTSLQFNWAFFESSLWAFNPFPAVPLAILIVVLLASRRFFLALILTLLLVNFELAAFVPILILCLITSYLNFRNRKETDFAKSFSKLTVLLTFISTIIFSISNYYRSWHSAFLPPILFIAFFLILVHLEKRIYKIMLFIFLAINIFTFWGRYSSYLKISDDSGLYINQVQILDWIYDDAENLGFNVYNYTPTYYDYPYQYLFWSHGLKKYSYLPQEYSNLPLAHKELYIPGSANYLEPRRNTDRLTYLIIEGSTNGEKNEEWINRFRGFHQLVGSQTIGKTVIEKYERNKNIPDDFCIWRNICD